MNVTDIRGERCTHMAVVWLLFIYLLAPTEYRRRTLYEIDVQFKTISRRGHRVDASDMESSPC